MNKVINEDSEVMGGCGFYPTEGLPEGYAELVKFYLSPKVRGKGYGSKYNPNGVEISSHTYGTPRVDEGATVTLAT